MMSNQFPKWVEWCSLALTAWAAPAIAILIHSLVVYDRGLTLYNAQIGGGYFFDGSRESFDHILLLATACTIPAIPTFLALLPFRTRTILRWCVWMASVSLWTWLLFKSEFAIK
jgi:hypothetical protein